MFRRLFGTPWRASLIVVIVAAVLGGVGWWLYEQPDHRVLSWPTASLLPPTRANWVGMGLVGVAAGVLLIGCLTAFPAALVPPSLRPAEMQLQPNDYITAQNDARSTLVNALVGLLLLVAAVITWRQLIISQEAQVTERYTRAVELLGDADLAVRVEAIHSLGRLARDSPKDDRSIYTLLTAYVRNHSPRTMLRPANADESEIWQSWVQRRRCETDHPGDGSLLKCAADIQAALGVLGAHPEVLSDGEPMRAVLTDTRLPGARCGHAQLALADLRGALLENLDCRTPNRPYTSFEGADFRGAVLTGARFGSANLRKAHLEFADLTGARLGTADLRGATYNSRTVLPEGFDPVAQGMVAATEAPTTTATPTTSGAPTTTTAAVPVTTG